MGSRFSKRLLGRNPTPFFFFQVEFIAAFGFAGSLRKESYNKSLLKAAVELIPPDATLEIFDLEGIPPFNQDLETQPPGKVKEFKAKIKAADAILIVTPEYNYSIPGVLKNAIDSASRPHGDNAFEGKPVAIMGASIGMLGTARAQYHLRQTRTKFPTNLHWRQRYLKILLTFRRTL